MRTSRLFLALVMAALCSMASEYRLTVDSRNGLKLDGTLRGGRFIQRGKTLVVSHVRKPTPDEYPLIRDELHEILHDCKVMESVDGQKLFMVARHMVYDHLGDETRRPMSTPELIKYLEENGGEWCMRGDVYGVRDGHITFCGWYSQRTPGWDARNGEDAVWGQLRSTAQGLPLPEPFDLDKTLKELRELDGKQRACKRETTW